MDGGILYQGIGYAFCPLLTLVEVDTDTRFERLSHAEEYLYDKFTLAHKWTQRIGKFMCSSSGIKK